MPRIRPASCFHPGFTWPRDSLSSESRTQLISGEHAPHVPGCDWAAGKLTAPSALSALRSPVSVKPSFHGIMARKVISVAKKYLHIEILAFFQNPAEVKVSWGSHTDDAASKFWCDVRNGLDRFLGALHWPTRQETSVCEPRVTFALMGVPGIKILFSLTSVWITVLSKVLNSQCNVLHHCQLQPFLLLL